MPDPRADEITQRVFGVVKPLIGVVHTLALPGSSTYDREAGMSPIIAAARHDALRCQEAGCDAIIFCNEGDLPYRVEVGVEQSTAMAAVIGELRPALRIPFGVDMLWDPLASLAVGKAVGARFVREVFVGVYESDMGQLRPDPGAAFAYRHAIGADDIALFTNLTPEFASPLGTRTVGDRAHGARFFGCARRLHLRPARRLRLPLRRPGGGEGGGAGHPGDWRTRASVTTPRSASWRRRTALIVGTSLKVDGRTENRVDAERVKRMVKHVRHAREHHVDRVANIRRAAS